MRQMKKALSVLLAALLVAALAVPAFAIDMPTVFSLFDEARANGDAKIYAAALNRDAEVSVLEYSIPVAGPEGQTGGDYYFAVLDNHPDVFYVDHFSKSSRSGDNLNGFDIAYYNYTADQIQRTNAAVADFVASVNALDVNEIDKVLFAINFLKERTYSGSTEDGKNSTAYDAIMTESADKYALGRALSWLLNALGVEAYYTEGGSMTCPFVTVFIGGKAYFVDTAINPIETMATLISEEKLISVRDDVKSSTPLKACDWKSVKGLCTTKTYDNAWWNISGKEMSYCDGYWYFSDGADLYRSRTTTPGEKEKLTSHARTDYTWFSTKVFLFDTVAAGGCIYFNSRNQIFRYNIETGEETTLYTLTAEQQNKGRICDLELDGNSIVYKLASKANVMAQAGYFTYTGSAVYACDTHVFGDWAICEPGNCQTHATEKRLCTVCGIAEYRESESFGPHVSSNWTVTDPATCEHTGTKVGICDLCGADATAEIPLAPHIYGEWTVTKAATCGEDGVETAVCTVCGDETTRPIPATGNHTDADGDELCDVCGADMHKELTGFARIWAKVKAFFDMIAQFFRNLFGRKN